MGGVGARQNRRRFLDEFGSDVTQGAAAGNCPFWIYWKHHLFPCLYHDEVEEDVFLCLYVCALGVQLRVSGVRPGFLDRILEYLPIPSTNYMPATCVFDFHL